MKIESVDVSNFRNIDKLKVTFNPEVNYIIGENNLGKSNFLSLLAIICGGKAFDENDFFDIKRPIEVELTIKLLQHEQGFFKDNFSPNDASMLKIRYKQEFQEAYPTIICVDSNESIHARQMRKINFLKYETTSAPSKELRLDTHKGTGLLISSIIEQFNNNTINSFLDYEQVKGLTTFINNHLEKIRSFRDYSIKVTVASDPNEILMNLFYLSDGNRKILTTSSGVQYMTMASIYILCQIMELYKSKSISFTDLLYTDSNKKILPLVLSIDEPEVHLHPYLQRSLIKYYKRILSNKDNDFLKLLKNFFDIDGIDGQLIIVTHSTDALTGDYRNLVRFYKKDNTIAAISGYRLRPDYKKNNDECIKIENEKHLIMHFPEIKEAFYAKCAILIEGETEYGCIHAFADKIGVPLDDFGICVINAGGENSIKPLRQLLDSFKIPSIAIYDGDVKTKHTSSDPNEFFTTELCFEIEIVKKLYSTGNTTIVRKIVSDIDNTADSIELDENFVRKSFHKMSINIEGYTPKKLRDVDDNNKNDFCQMFSTWFMVKKGVLLGRTIGEAISANDIPACYHDAIKKAQEVASHV